MGFRERNIALAAGLAIAVLATPMAGETAAGCRWFDKPGMSAVVLCPPGSSLADWRQAGAKACGASGPCHAWIWTDPTKAPNSPITPDSPMNDEQFEAAAAVWVDYIGTLFVCDGVLC